MELLPPSLPLGQVPILVCTRGHSNYHPTMTRPEDLVGDEWADWYRLTPLQRWLESERLWQTYLLLGGSLDPEPDTQSPFHDPAASGPSAPDGRSGLRILRRGRV